MKIKICGIRRHQDIEYVNEFLPDYIGFIFAKSKRQITSSECLVLKKELDPSIKTVGVFVNESLEKVISTTLVANLDVIQLHGDETKEYILDLKNKLKNSTSLKDTLVWKAIRVKGKKDIISGDKLPVDCLLLDSFSKQSYGGTGKTIDLDIIKSSTIKNQFFLAGGLNIDNILNTLSEVSPYGVDISSGVETDGFKDKNKIGKIINCIRRK